MNPGHRGPLLVLALLACLGIDALGGLGHAEGRSRVEGRDATVVIALAGEGINPYHIAFRAPLWTDHPSSYLPGYPRDARPLRLTLDASSFEDAWRSDAAVWASVQRGALYYVPGTRIIALVCPATFCPDENVFFDGGSVASSSYGHGTLVADAAAGSFRGAAPNAALAVISGNRADALRWASTQAWIDIVSVSSGDWLGVGLVGIDATPRWSATLAASGRPVFVGSGNGPPGELGANVLMSAQGPPWTFTVGLVHGNGSEQYPYFLCPACGRPFEVAGVVHGDYARTKTLDGTHPGGGTSLAAPTVAGTAARLVEELRVRYGHERIPAGGSLVRLPDGAPRPGAGPLADGVLEREELEEVLRQSGRPVPMVPVVDWEPAPETRYAHQGYGMIDGAAIEIARRLLHGTDVSSPRVWDDASHGQADSVAYAYWAPWACSAALELPAGECSPPRR